MTKNIQVFISYKRADLSQREGVHLTRILEKAGFGVFMDKNPNQGLEPGDDWAQTLYDNLYSSHVLIVLLEPDTEKSDWVQREVDIARGAHVSILPLKLSGETVSVEGVQRKLAIEATQYLEFDSTGENFDTLVESLERLSDETRRKQYDWIKDLQQESTGIEVVNKARVASFPLDEDGKCQLHLSSGDMIKLKNVDVMVNSENDYMQMARIFESSTLSSALRMAGALRINGRLREDSVQEALDAQIRNKDNDYDLPIIPGQVIPTPAGHPEGTLRQNGTRYIFHAATVQVFNAKTRREKVVPIQDADSFRETVNNCLDTVRKVNRQRGVISPAGSKAYLLEQEQADSYQPIKSIAFPIFGTGHGGLKIGPKIIRPMVRGFQEYIDEYHNTDYFSITDIYLSAYLPSDVEIVLNILNNQLKDGGHN